MKVKTLIWTLLASLACVTYAQPPELPGEEALETVRFIRLAETKKALDFLSEDQLLQLNDILDSYEKKRFENRRQEVALRPQVKTSQTDASKAGELLDQFIALRDERHQNDKALYQEVRALLNDSEALAFFAFYEDFQNKIRRRIHMLQRAESGQAPGRRGPGRFRN